jgi:hypothetical protein
MGAFIAGCGIPCGANIGGKLDECRTRWNLNLKIVMQGAAIARGKSHILPSGVEEFIGGGVVVHY